MKRIITLTVLLMSYGLQISTMAQTIVVDPDTYEIKIIHDGTDANIQENETIENIQTGQEEIPSDINQNTDAEDTTQTVTTTTIKSPSISEFEQALSRMYKNQMTMFNNTDQYEPFNQLTRGQFAKMVNRFSIVVGYDRSIKNTNCKFKDLDQADPTLQPHIIKTCEIGIFKGYQDFTFQPNKILTKAEALAVLLRIYNGKRSDESTNPRWNAYYQQAKKLNITNEQNPKNLEQVINRYLIALYLYRLSGHMHTAEPTSDETIEQNETTEAITTKQIPAIVNITKLGNTINKIVITSETQNITLVYNSETKSYTLIQ